MSCPKPFSFPTSFTVLLLAFFLLCSCSQPPADLPPAPEVYVDGMLPAIAEVIGKAKKQQHKKPYSATTNGKLAMLLHANELPTLADGYYARARKLDASEFRWAYLHGLCLEELGEVTAATAAFADAVALDKAYVPAALKHAGALMGAGDMALSGTLYESLLDQNRTRADVHFFYGRWLLQNTQPTVAVEHLKEALRLNGDFAQGHYLLASAYQQTGNETQAHEHTRLFNLHSNRKLTVSDQVRHSLNEQNASDRPHIIKAQDLLLVGKYNEAIPHFVRAAEANPKRVGTLVNLVMLYGQRKDVTNVRKYYDAALALDPSNPKPHFYFGNLLLSLKQPGEAIGYFNKAIVADENFLDARAQIAAAKLALGDEAGAVDAMKMVLAQDGRHRQVNFLYGKHLALKNKNYEAALTHLRQALKPEDRMTVLILHTMAGIQATQGQLDDAVTTLRNASTLAEEQRVSGSLKATIDRQLARFEAMQDQNEK